MIDRQKILEEINKTKEHLANMEKMLEECEYRRWKPEEKDYYYYIDINCEAWKEVFYNTNSIDNARYNTYNCFQTREQAEAEAEKILVRRMLEDIARRLNKGEKIDWNNLLQCKYYFYLWNGGELDQNTAREKLSQGTIYCLDQDFLDVAKSEIGEERLKKYLRGE